MSLLHDRFEIIDELGRGAQAITHRALDHFNGEYVALKELDFRRVDDWKAHELFEREGKTLQSLDHPAIPHYVDAFVIEEDDEIRVFLAQEFVDGPTLEQELDEGRRWDETSLVDDAKQLLEALAYLHSLTPPVIHRDIKPSNIMRRPGGQLALIDFGAVQNALPETVGGSTVIGTPGYMPIEQLMGRAVPATDLYAFGATCVHLLSRCEPSSLDVVRNRIQFREVVDVSDRLAEILTRLLEPSAEDRYADASEVLHEFDDLKPWSPATKDLPDSPDELPPVGDLERPEREYPRWVTVTPKGDDRFTIEFDMRDHDERALAVVIDDDVDELRLFVSRRKPFNGMLMAGLVVVALIAARLPFGTLWTAGVLVAALSAIVWHHAPRSAQRKFAELEVDSETFSIETYKEQINGPTRRLRGCVLEDQRLLIDFEGAAPVELFGLSEAEGFREEWLSSFLQTRIGEIARPLALGSGSEVADDEARSEFWKEEPAELSRSS